MHESLDAFIRSFDFSQAGVSLRFKKYDSYASLTGGICSLLMIITIMSYGFLNLLQVF